MKKAENAIKDKNVERAASRSLVVKILQAKDLPAADRNKKSDPYCTVEYGGETHKTSVVKKNLNPFWEGDIEEDYVFQFPIKDNTSKFESLSLRVLDWDRFGADDFLGEATVDINHLGLIAGGESVRAWYELFKPMPKKKASWGFRTFRGKRGADGDVDDPAGMMRSGTIRIEVGIAGSEPAKVQQPDRQQPRPVDAKEEPSADRPDVLSVVGAEEYSNRKAKKMQLKKKETKLLRLLWLL